MPAPSPRIYVASLSDYNAGNLHGRWIDADQDADAILDEITEMLAESKIAGAEEWAIHDSEGFAPVNISENEDLDVVAELAGLIEEYGEIFAHVYDYASKDMEQAKKLMTEGYRGVFSSIEAYAEDYIEQTGDLKNIPEYLQRYIDYAAFANDLVVGGDVTTIECDGKTHVFDNTI